MLGSQAGFLSIQDCIDRTHCRKRRHRFRKLTSFYFRDLKVVFDSVVRVILMRCFSLSGVSNKLILLFQSLIDQPRSTSCSQQSFIGVKYEKCYSSRLPNFIFPFQSSYWDDGIDSCRFMKEYCHWYFDRKLPERGPQEISRFFERYFRCVWDSLTFEM